MDVKELFSYIVNYAPNSLKVVRNDTLQILIPLKTTSVLWLSVRSREIHQLPDWSPANHHNCQLGCWRTRSVCTVHADRMSRRFPPTSTLAPCHLHSVISITNCIYQEVFLKALANRQFLHKGSSMRVFVRSCEQLHNKIQTLNEFCAILSSCPTVSWHNTTKKVHIIRTTTWVGSFTPLL